MKYNSEAQHEAVMAAEGAKKAPGLYRPIGTTSSPLRQAAMNHIKKPRTGKPAAGLMQAPPPPPTTPSY